MLHALSLAYDQSPQKSHPSLTVVMSTTKLSPRTAAEQAVQQAPASPPPVSLNTAASPQLLLTLSVHQHHQQQHEQQAAAFMRGLGSPPRATTAARHTRTKKGNGLVLPRSQSAATMFIVPATPSTAQRPQTVCHNLDATQPPQLTHQPPTTTTTPRSLMAPCSHVRVHKLPQQHGLAHGPRLVVPSRLQAPGQP